MKVIFQKKNTFFKRAFFQVLFAVAVLGCVPHQAQASMWGSVEMNAWAVDLKNQVWTQIQASLKGALKQAVGQILNTQISVMIGGGNGKGVQFITNWQGFLVSEPQKQTNTFMNDFFSATTRGRNSLSNYKPASKIPPGCEWKDGTITDACIHQVSALTDDRKSWLAGEGIVSSAQADTTPSAGNPSCGKATLYRCVSPDTSCSSIGPDMSEDSGCTSFCGGGWKYCVSRPPSAADANYYKYQEGNGRAAISTSVPDIDLLNYASGPSDVFQGGNWRGFNAFFSNPANNPFGYSLMAKEAYQNTLSQEQRKADIQAVAYQGFKASVGPDGFTVKTPGITIGKIVDKVQGFSMDSISSASEWGEIISSAATTAIGFMVDTGLAAAQSAIQTGLDTGMQYLSSATGGLVNVRGLQAPALADINWTNSGEGSASELNSGLSDFNSDAQSMITGGDKVWGDMNFNGTNIGGTSLPKQNSYDTLIPQNYESLNTTPTTPAPSTYIPNTTWDLGDTQPPSSDLWVPESLKNK